MATSSLFPGFRFHPTDAELVMYYLKRKLLGKKIIVNAVAEVNIYDFSPWDLPDKASLKSRDLEWFFFCPKSKKYTSGSRFNRATETGFWKATGKDRKVTYKGRTVATIKTLVFHLGHASNGQRTDWVMHEYKMEDELLAKEGIVQDMYVLCKIFEKSGSGPKNGAQYGAPFNEEEWGDDVASCSESQTLVVSAGATNKVDYKQKGPAIMNMTDPGSSTVTYSANETTNTLNYKQKGPATINMTEPGSSVVTYSANENTITLNYKQKGPAIMNMTEPGSSTVTFSGNDRHVDVCVNDDVMLYEDIIASIMGEESTKNLNGNGENECIQGVEVAKEKKVNEDDGIYDNLVNLINLDDLNGIASNNFKRNGTEYALDKILTADDLDDDLKEFYVD